MLYNEASCAWNYHGDLEAGPARPQHVSQRYPAVLQDDVGGGRRSDAQLVFLLAPREARVRHWDQERTDPLRTRKSNSESIKSDKKTKKTNKRESWKKPRRRTLCLSDLSVVAKTTVADASQQLVIQALVPFRTHSSPSWRAVVEAAPASLPLPVGIGGGATASLTTIQSALWSCWCLFCNLFLNV